MDRRRFLQATSLTLAAASVPGLLRCGGSRPHPPLVYINVDDLGWNDLAFMGHLHHRTPRIDGLAREGMAFSAAYAPAANCAPSRASALTGQYTPRHGMYTVGSAAAGPARHRKLVPVANRRTLPDGEVTMAEALRLAGYRTGHVGKWHVGDDPRTQGFEVNVAGSRWGYPRFGYFSPWRMPHLEDGPEGEYLTDRLTDEAIAYARAHWDEPFFLHLSFYAVHGPNDPKRRLWRHYARSLGLNAGAYAAHVEVVDHNVGRLLDALEELGLADDVLVLLSSDNGGRLRREPLRGGKGEYYEGGIRVPLVVRWPGRVPPGARSDTPVIGVDFFPTFLEAAGLGVPSGATLDGQSLVPLLTGRGSFADRALYWHFPYYLEAGFTYSRKMDPDQAKRRFRVTPGSAIRHGDWKLLEHFEDGAAELYHLGEDPGERRDLAGERPEVARELRERLAAWRRRVGAPVPRQRNPEYVD